MTVLEGSRPRLAVIHANSSALSWRRSRSLRSSQMPSSCRRGRTRRPYLQPGHCSNVTLPPAAPAGCSNHVRGGPGQAPAHRQYPARALAQGIYDGPADGIWGAKTDAAVRDFIQTAGLKINPEANDALLRAIAAFNPKPPNAPTASNPPSDPIAKLIAPSKKVMAVQRALADFGYGQIKPTGVFDPDTRAAVEKFEREHRMPVTGQISDRFVRELAAMSGRPLE